MTRLFLLILILVLQAGCTKEVTISPEPNTKLLGVYEGGVYCNIGGETYQEEEVSAIVEYVNERLYTIEIKDFDLRELPVFEIKIIEVLDETQIRFDVLNEAWLVIAQCNPRPQFNDDILNLYVGTEEEIGTFMFHFSGRK